MGPWRSDSTGLLCEFSEAEAIPRIAGTDIVCHFLPDDLCKDGDYPSRFVGMTRIKDRALWDGKRNPVLYDEESVKHMSNLQNYDVE